ncbi:MAG: ATPase [Actinobacteria bacterium HGW-Actinobacteria-8]|nr:MAG: ATPase [Actinobacteria bacterium HGW-Actinobacteria-8]
MPWREDLSPVRMERVALVATEPTCRQMLVEVARSGTVELDLPYPPGSDAGEIDRAQEAAARSGTLTGLVGWMPARNLAALQAALGAQGAAVVPIAHPRGVQPPTLLNAPASRRPRVSRTLVDTYATVPYADVDPSRLAGVAYVVMFGMMFGDLGHGAVLLVLGLVLRGRRSGRLAALAKAWAFVAGAGLAAMAFGVLYGEAFGPTGLIPVVWLNPLESPTALLVVAVGLGAVLLAISYGIGTVNRVREGGWGYAIYARTGVAGSALFASMALLTWGVVADLGTLVVVAVVVAIAALVLVFTGLLIAAGGGGSGFVQAVVELLDTVVRLGSNIVSFARLAAFGLTHGALLMIVWDGTTGLWGPGWRAVAAVLLFVVGNVVTFALEALIAGIQALRLEYYELFSRIFQSEGRPFRPWAPTLPKGSPAQGEIS